LQTNTSAEHSDTIREKIATALKDIDRRSDIEISTLFSLVPESHTPLISTGKRCRDEESGEDFVCLGFAHTEKEHLYETKLSMVQTKNSHVIGLVINKGRGSSSIQNQK